MNCIFVNNPAGGFEKEHTRLHCVYEHNPPQVIAFHVYLENWCGNVCRYCFDKLRDKHPGCEFAKVPPWKRIPKSLPL